MPRVLETVTRYVTKPPCRTAEQMTEICCKEAEAVQCCEKVEWWDGYSDDEVIKRLGLNLDGQGRDAQGRYVEIRRLPRSKPCGEKVTRYDVAPRGCCDEATPLSFDGNATPDVLPHGQTIWLYAAGGIPPYRFSVTNNSLSFDDGRRSWVTDVPFARLHAGETFCGSAVVTVSDGCSTANWSIRSDLGHWEPMGNLCIFPGATDWIANPGYPSSEVRQKILGMYRQDEELEFFYWAAGNVQCPVENGDPADLCLPDCGPALAAKLESLRPDGALHSPCMYANVAANRNWPDWYTMNDGATVTVHPTYATSYFCNGTGGGVGSGSTTLKIAAYYKSANLDAYKWVC